MSGPARAAPLLLSVCHRVRATRRLQRKVAKTADGRGLAISVTVGETAVLKAFPGADALWAARAGRSVTNPSRKGRRTCAPTKRKPRSARGKSHVRRMSGQLGDWGNRKAVQPALGRMDMGAAAIPM